MSVLCDFVGCITMEQARFMANPKYDDNLIYEMGNTFQDSESIEEVKEKYDL